MKQERRFLVGALAVVALAAALVLIVAGSQRALAQAGGIIYVDVNAVGRDDGNTWSSAYTDLQDALDDAGPEDQIWVAAGTYKPTRRFIPDDPRSATFQMVNGVAIYGGFEPDEGVTKFENRDWVAHETILSGNIGDADRSDDNSYHVFYHPEDLALDSTAILDGFTITGGNADQEDPSGLRGGGMSNDHASPVLTNVTFVGNLAGYGGGLYVSEGYPQVGTVALTNVTFLDNSAGYGGGIWVSAPYPEEIGGLTLTNIAFEGNSADYDGGAMYVSSPLSISEPLTFTNCTFSGNSAERGGGAFVAIALDVPPGAVSDTSPLRLTNCIFWGNTADLGGGLFITGGELDTDTVPFRLTNCTFSGNEAELGGAIYALGPVTTVLTLTNSILWGDTAGGLPNEIYTGDPENPLLVTYSDVEGGYEGEGNIDEDPSFVDPDAGDLHLQPGSVCIDSANNGPELAQYDIDGEPRIMDGDGDGYAVVDMGADEFKMPTIPVEIEITPGIPTNVIKLSSPRRVPVAILTTDDFDAVARVAPDTVEFAGATHVGYTFVDVDKDGHDDVLLDFRARDMVDLDEGSTEATLTGETLAADPFEGQDEVRVIP